MSRYRVIRAAPKPQTPIEALVLAEDMERIKTAIERLSLIDPLSICDNREDGQYQIKLWLINLKRHHDHAQQKLRRDYLSVESEAHNSRSPRTAQIRRKSFQESQKV